MRFVYKTSNLPKHEYELIHVQCLQSDSVVRSIKESY